MKKLINIRCVAAFVLAACLLIISCDSEEGAQSGSTSSNEAKGTSVVDVRDDRRNTAAKTKHHKVQDETSHSSKQWELILNVPDKPVILEDLSQVQVREGVEPPELGTTVYPVSKLPKVACGQFWIFFGDGYIDKVYSCTHEGDKPHQ